MNRLAEAFARDLKPRDAVEAQLHPFARLLRRAYIAQARRDAEAMKR